MFLEFGLNLSSFCNLHAEYFMYSSYKLCEFRI